ncbi:MAG TPA: asparagine synthase (glutamine-hydrolyzing), partial [Acidimicrobiales bacterium]|nr:asparagine synthase (glutamine-hydrolyzing) [Acidimicrobiales bacterium]
MCGIAGVLDPAWTGDRQDLPALATAMASRVAHRGPDDEGTWSDPDAGVAFSHRRLAVIDLSPAGHQPMVSTDGRWVIVYNGECYNADDLRSCLPEHRRAFRGHCDTEVVVEAVAAWGVRQALERIDGMFALALWDRSEKVLHLVRDRLGEKPLYYSVNRGRVLFGSELRALTADPAFDKNIDRRALTLYLQLSYVPAPFTIYRAARKLAAGTMVSFRPHDARWPQPTQWWDFRSMARTATEFRTEPPSNPHALDELERRLRESVARRLAADVPVGTFLSGGIDSSLVTALAQATSSRTVRTFTVGFGGKGLDESAYAAAVANHLGTEHTEMHLTPNDALNLAREFQRYWDEPFADPSALPSLLLCSQARRHVTVALSGDGGDEVFGGYRRYTAGAFVVRLALPLPAAVRRAGAKALHSIPAAVLGRLGRGNDLGNRIYKLSGAMVADSVKEMFSSLVSAWDDAENVVLGDADGSWNGPPDLPWATDPIEAMMAWDTLLTLPDEMLTKVDRASMAFGLEVRVPLLDHRVVQSAWELPSSLRVARGQGKRALRLLLDRYVPR